MLSNNAHKNTFTTSPDYIGESHAVEHDDHVGDYHCCPGFFVVLVAFTQY